MRSISVALVYLGSIMGAGFASGREAWQYFGVFGKDGYYGLAAEAVLFIALGCMACYIAIRKKSSDIGTIVIPIENGASRRILSTITEIFIYFAVVSMTAAGGALLYQKFGLPKYVGGILIALLALITVLGDFERVSRVLAFIMPVLFTIVIVLCLYVTLFVEKKPSDESVIIPSPLTGSWPFAAILFVAYNFMGSIPIIAQASIRAHSPKRALPGAAAGGIMLALLCIVLVTAMQKDRNMSDLLDLPLLGFAGKLSKTVELIVAAVLFISIYSSATSCFYASTNSLRGKHRKTILAGLSAIAFIIGLAGFKNMVAYIYPIEGYFGIMIIILLTLNFIKTVSEGRKNEH